MAPKEISARTRRVLRTLLLLALLALLVVPVSASPAAPATAIGFIQITDVKDSSLVVSWITDVPANGIARCYTPGGVLVQQAEDSRSDLTVHYVTVTGLAANTQYLCEAESAGVVANNGGARFAVTMGPTPGATSPGNHYVWGYVRKANNNLAPYTIVFIRLLDSNGAGSPGRSQWVSARAEPSGVWSFNLLNTRKEDASDFFVFTPGADSMEIWVQGGADGTWGYPPMPETVMLIPTAPTTQLADSVLNGEPLAANLNSFSAAAQSDGILLTWDTASEIGNQGFNLYRATDPAGPQDLLTFVPSQAPGSTQGFAYQWLDAVVTAGETYYYWLADVDLAGTATLHGPVSLTFQAPTAVEAASFAAQPAGGAPLAPWLLALPALLGAAAYGLRRRSWRSPNM